MDGSGMLSAPADQRAAELTAMLTDPSIRAVVPPWGGELAADLLLRLDFARIAEADPAWFVGYSDISTLLLALTTRTGVATLHGQNLMNTPVRRPPGLLHWLEAASARPGAVLRQRASTRHKGPGFSDIIECPEMTEPDLDQPGSWRLLDPGAGPVRVSGRLIGGCLETVVCLAGTPFGDVAAFAEKFAPEGLIVYVEVAEHGAADVGPERMGLRLAGWFDRANAILVGRTHAPATGSFTQEDAARFAFGDMGIPVILDVDCGHVAPELALVNGALADILVDGSDQRIVQTLS
jgi:muramoyltetrapeptide carboxypeptidase